MLKVRYNPFTQGILLSVSVLLLGGVIYASQFLVLKTAHPLQASRNLHSAKQEFKQLARLSDLKKEFILKPYTGEIHFSGYHQNNRPERWANWPLWEKAVHNYLAHRAANAEIRSDYSTHSRRNLLVAWLARSWTTLSQLVVHSISMLLSDKSG